MAIYVMLYMHAIHSAQPIYVSFFTVHANNLLYTLLALACILLLIDYPATSANSLLLLPLRQSTLFTGS